jgi:hypothetical protein
LCFHGDQEEEEEEEQMIRNFIININPIYFWSNVMYFVFLNVMNVLEYGYSKDDADGQGCH